MHLDLIGESRKVHPPNHIAGRRLDLRDAFLLPYVGINEPVHPLKLVQPPDGPPVVRDLYPFDGICRLGVYVIQGARRVAHDEVRSVVRDAPAVSKVRRHRRRVREVFHAVCNHLRTLPCHLVQLATESRDAFPEILVDHPRRPEHLPGADVHLAHRRLSPKPGRLYERRCPGS